MLRDVLVFNVKYYLFRIGWETHTDDVNVLIFCFCACPAIPSDVDIAFRDECVAWWHIVVCKGDLR